MHKTIISDTSCLILLDKIGELDILYKLFGTIITTSEVAEEFGQPLPSWFELRQPTDKNYQTIIEASVDKGEASAIALAIELDDCLLIIDDLKGRKFAHQLGLTIIGTIGVIVDAKLAGIIPSVKPILAKIKATNFRITEQLELLILKRASEYDLPPKN
jgi:predicted nucleic acid-binding protein